MLQLRHHLRLSLHKYDGRRTAITALKSIANCKPGEPDLRVYVAKSYADIQYWLDEAFASAASKPSQLSKETRYYSSGGIDGSQSDMEISNLRAFNGHQLEEDSFKKEIEAAADDLDGSRHNLNAYQSYGAEHYVNDKLPTENALDEEILNNQVEVTPKSLVLGVSIRSYGSGVEKMLTMVEFATDSSVLLVQLRNSESMKTRSTLAGILRSAKILKVGVGIRLVLSELADYLRKSKVICDVIVNISVL